MKDITVNTNNINYLIKYDPNDANTKSSYYSTNIGEGIINHYPDPEINFYITLFPNSLVLYWEDSYLFENAEAEALINNLDIYWLSKRAMEMYKCDGTHGSKESFFVGTSKGIINPANITVLDITDYTDDNKIIKVCLLHRQTPFYFENREADLLLDLLKSSI